MKNIFFACTSSNKKSKKGKKKVRRNSSTYGYSNNAPVNRAFAEHDTEVDKNENEIEKLDKETQIECLFIDVACQSVLEKQVNDFQCQVEQEQSEERADVKNKDDVIDSGDIEKSVSSGPEGTSKPIESIGEIETEENDVGDDLTEVKKPVSTSNAKACLWKAVKKASSANTGLSEFKIEDVVSEEGELLNAAAVRKLLQKPTVKSYTSFMICLKKGSAKFVEHILHECDALQLMFDALAALSMKSIGSFTDTILQLSIVRALKMILNSSVGIVYLIEEDRGFVSDLAYGKDSYNLQSRIDETSSFFHLFLIFLCQL